MKTAAIQSQKSLVLLITVSVVLALFPVIGAPRLWLLYLFIFFIYLSLANMWNLLAGYSGLISLCPAAFIGLAGYTMTILTWVGCPYYIGMILGSLVAALFALIISFPVFRMKGIYFAIGTLVVPEILRYVFLMWVPVGKPLYGGGGGYPIKGVNQIPPALTYWLALAVALVSILIIRLILRSKLGTGLAAIRDNDNTAACSGVNVFKLKLYSFVIAAFISGLAGAIFYVYQGYIEPSSAFSIQWLVIIMLATVIGGEGTEGGPILGTLVVVFLYFSLARYAEISLIMQGIILVIIMLLAPQGIIGFLRKIRT
ncbi:MAG: branched-chain amino acid ABC transporter permease [Desulfobacterales bacterium]|jgi:branched-chain amino acid transport system permease protein